MKNELSEALINRFNKKKYIFLTGDLGFNALENLHKKIGSNFINAGIAEQNMVGVAAGLAIENMETWIYSIAPFLYGRAFEQIRNDICFHNLPVKIIGTGGGYGYGLMGPSHYSIDDYGILLGMPNMKVFIPVFSSDIPSIIKKMSAIQSPSYLRLSIDETETNNIRIPYKKFRKLTSGNGKLIICAGSIAGYYMDNFNKISINLRPNIWVLSELPIRDCDLPKALIDEINYKKEVYIIEEHIMNGGLLSHLTNNTTLLSKLKINSIKHFYAKNHIFNTYGSKNFLRKKSKLDFENILKIISR